MTPATLLSGNQRDLLRNSKDVYKHVVIITGTARPTKHQRYTFLSIQPMIFG